MAEHQTQVFVECGCCDGSGVYAKRVTVYEPGCGFSHDDTDEVPCPECNGDGVIEAETQPMTLEDALDLDQQKLDALQAKEVLAMRGNAMSPHAASEDSPKEDLGPTGQHPAATSGPAISAAAQGAAPGPHISFEVRRVKRGLWTYDIYQDGRPERGIGECRSRRHAEKNARTEVARRVARLVEWLSTKAKSTSIYSDSGIKGWRLHAVPMDDRREYYADRALCGLGPRHGWEVDLFITDKCKRCAAIIRATGAQS